MAVYRIGLLIGKRTATESRTKIAKQTVDYSIKLGRPVGCYEDRSVSGNMI